MSDAFNRENIDNAWCPGCGNFVILKVLKSVFEEMGLDKREVVITSGIGQAAKTPHYIDVNMYNGLHGRAIPVATAIKTANPKLTVIAEGGDGDMYGEGGNHFLNAIRRNVNIVNIVHNNMVYGLTKGQASPTSQPGFRTGVQVDGVINEPFNPLAIAISAGAGFVSRVSVTNIEHAKNVIKEAVQHKGYALVDIFQPCVTFNKINTFDFFKENTYLLDGQYNNRDLHEAFKKAMEYGKFPLGIFYKHEKPTFEENHKIERPLFENTLPAEEITKLYQSKI